MPDFVEHVNKMAQLAAQKLNVRSALNPMLWLCGITSPLCFVFAFVFSDNFDLCLILILGGLFPIIIACFGFVGFAIFKPEKLQSEEYQIRHESLQIIQQKSGSIVIPPTSIEAIANPQAIQFIEQEE